ncbi:MAG: aldose 1-epimerase [Chitinophagales bacterium]
MHFFQKYDEDGFEVIELDNDEISVKIVVNIGNTLFSLKQHDDEKMYFPFSFEEYQSNQKLAGNPLMHPWANRLESDAILIENQLHSFPEDKLHLIYRDGNNLPLHGLLLKTDKWKTIDLHEDAQTCYHIAELVFDAADWLSIFPFVHKIQVKHQLQKNELKIETTIINHDEKPMPVSFGFHPYFLIDSTSRHQYSLVIPAENVIETNEVMIPNGKLIQKEKLFNFQNHQINLNGMALDNGFQDLILNEKNQVVFSLNDMKIVFDKNYAFAQIYAPDNIGKPYVCIEPMTAATNAINRNTCKMLAKNEAFTAGFSIVL